MVVARESRLDYFGHRLRHRITYWAILETLWTAAGIKISANHTWIKWGTRAVRAAIIWICGAWCGRILKQRGRETNRNSMTVLDYLVATITAIVISLAIAGLAVIRGRGASLSAEWLPDWIAGLAATIVVLFVVVFVTSDVLFEQGMEYAYGMFAEKDQEQEPGVEQPYVSERSGSPASFEKWENIGVQGKRFLSRGPRASDIAEVTGQEAQEPIRIYAGLAHDRDLEDVAQIVVEEIRRTHAFDRSVLVLSTVTGTGWVEEWGIQPVEYLTRGDCATVTMQYSYVPSAIAFLREFDKPAEAAKVLYHAVMTELEKIPEEDRPAIYLHGVSLGAFGSQAIFEDEADMIAQVDGAVWAGTPNSTPLWQKLTAERHLGSPEIAPVVNNGRNIRFATKPEDLQTDIYGRSLPQWDYPALSTCARLIRWCGGSRSWFEPRPTGCANLRALI